MTDGPCLQLQAYPTSFVCFCYMSSVLINDGLECGVDMTGYPSGDEVHRQLVKLYATHTDSLIRKLK